MLKKIIEGIAVKIIIDSYLPLSVLLTALLVPLLAFVSKYVDAGTLNNYKLEKLFHSSYNFLVDFSRDAMEFSLNALKHPDTFSFVSGDKTLQIKSDLDLKPYQQVFSEKFGFIKEVSILDVIFNLGPDAGDYLEATASS